VLRYVGFAAGSAATAALLAAATPAGAGLPSNQGYTRVAVVACVLCLGTAVLVWLLPGDLRPAAPVERMPHPEDVADVAAAPHQ